MVDPRLESLVQQVGELNTTVTLTDLKVEVTLKIKTEGLREYSDALYTKAMLGLQNFAAYNCTSELFYEYLQWLIVQRVLLVRRETKVPGAHKIAGMKIPALLAVMLMGIGVAKDAEHGLIFIPVLPESKEISALKSKELADYSAPVQVCRGLESLSEVMGSELPRSPNGDPEVMSLQYLKTAKEIQVNAWAPLFQGEGVYGYMPMTHAGLSLFAQILELSQKSQIQSPTIYFGMYKYLAGVFDSLLSQARR